MVLLCRRVPPLPHPRIRSNEATIAYMNINPYAIQAPDSVEHTISSANATCVRFNRGLGLFAGHYMAAGCTDGLLLIISTETKGLLRILQGHVRAVTHVSWSRYNRFLASSSSDWNVIVWDMKHSTRAHTIRFDGPVARVHFSNTTSKSLLVVLQSQQVLIVQLRSNRRRNTRHENGVNGHDAGSSQPEVMTEVRNELGVTEGYSGSVVSATYSADGELVVCGTTKGVLLVFDARTKHLIYTADGGPSAVRELAFDRQGKNLVTNSNDRSIRLFAFATSEQQGSLTREVSITPLHRLQDLINRTPWYGIGFSGDGEYVFGGATHKAAHNIYIWDRGAGVLDKVLQGPRDSLIDVDWHPNRPMLASVSHTGAINVWFNTPTEIWSAYAPGFEELEENEIYAEREDEFDLEDEEEVTRRKQDEEEAHVDVLLHGQRDVVKATAARAIDDVAVHEEDEDLDGDCDEAFCIPVRLSLDLPDLDVED